MSEEHTVTNDSQLKIADEEIARLRKQLIELQSDKVEIISQRDTWIGNADALRKQLIELQTDKVELISQRDNWIGSSDALRKQLDIARGEREC